MKQFFKFVLASMVAIIITSVILIFVIIGIIASSSEKTVGVEPESVLHIQFNKPITERTPDNPFKDVPFLGLDQDESIGLNDILLNIKKAKTDTNIKGIFLDETEIPVGEATSEEIRNALIDFKKSGKFVIAYSEIYTQGFYYLASVADEVYLNPKGIFLFHGFSQQITFLKGALDKIGIEAQNGPSFGRSYPNQIYLKSSFDRGKPSACSF